MTTDTSLDPPGIAGTPRPHRKLLRLSHAALMTVAVSVTGGAIYETLASRGDAASYPPAGQLVDVGGYRLHLDCRGSGSPTIVMDAGLGGSSLDWSLVQPVLSQSTRVCSCDRAGMGASEPGPEPRTPERIATELHTLLENAGIEGPIVLVGHSLAGKTVRMFAHDYPSDVAGMVLVDARSEEVDMALSVAETDGFKGALNGQAMLYTVARRLGIARLFGVALLGQEPGVSHDLAQEMVLMQTTPNAIAATTAEGMARSDDDRILANSTLGAMPLVVIAAKESMDGIAGWPAAQKDLAALSTRGRLVVAPTGHAVQLEDPNLVIEAVQSVIENVQTRN